MEAESSRRTEANTNVLGDSKINSRGSDEMEGNGGGPMFHKEQRVLSQVKIINIYLNLHCWMHYCGTEKPVSANVCLRLKTEEQTFRHEEGLDKSVAVVLTYNESLRIELSEHYQGVEMTENRMRILPSGLYFFYLNFEFKFAPSTKYPNPAFKCPSINVVRERGEDSGQFLLSCTPPCQNGAGYHSSYHEGNFFIFDAADILLVVLTDQTIFNPKATFAVIGLYKLPQ